MAGSSGARSQLHDSQGGFLSLLRLSLPALVGLPLRKCSLGAVCWVLRVSEAGMALLVLPGEEETAGNTETHVRGDY